MVLKIMEVNSKNLKEFNAIINKKNNTAIVKFYADWCGHCQDLNPKWQQMSYNLNNNKLDGVLASVSEKYKTDVDCDSEIVGYPTIRIFKGGRKKRDYNGKREVKDLEKLVRKTLGKRRSKKKNKTQKKKSTRRKSRRKRKTRKNRRKTNFRDRFFDMISNR